MPKPSKQPQTPMSNPSENSLAHIAAQTQADFELEFFNGILLRHPHFVDALRVHAKNLAAKKRHLEGVQMDRRLTQLCPDDPLMHYNLACSYALTRQPDLALETLRKAVLLGYHDFQFMQEDHDLDSIRKDPRFRAILREFRKQ